MSTIPFASFTPADVEANRQGRLSDAQRKRFNTKIDAIPWSTRYGAFIGALWSVFIILGGTSLIDRRLRQQLLSMLLLENLRDSLIVLFLVGVWVGLPLAWDLWYFQRRTLIRTVDGMFMPSPGMMQTRVIRKRRRYQGKASLSPNLLNKARIKNPLIDVKVLSAFFSQHSTLRFFSMESMRYLKPGQRCRVYYLAYYSKLTLLSVEALADEKSKR